MKFEPNLNLTQNDHRYFSFFEDGPEHFQTPGKG